MIRRGGILAGVTAALVWERRSCGQARLPRRRTLPHQIPDQQPTPPDHRRANMFRPPSRPSEPGRPPASRRLRRASRCAFRSCRSPVVRPSPSPPTPSPGWPPTMSRPKETSADSARSFFGDLAVSSLQTSRTRTSRPGRCVPNSATSRCRATSAASGYGTTCGTTGPPLIPTPTPRPSTSPSPRSAYTSSTHSPPD